MKHRKTIINYRLLVFVAMLLAGVLAVFSAVSPRVGDSLPVESFGQYTFSREVEAGGTTYHLYESGEQNFRYYHDQNGFILLVEEDGVYYAKEKEGRPVSSGVRFSEGNTLASGMTRYDINFEENPDLYEEAGGELLNAPLNAAGAEDAEREIQNLIILIAFKDDSAATLTAMRASAASINSNQLNGASNSLADYFYTVTNGTLTVESHMPMTNGAAYIYQDTQNRSYYNVPAKNTSRTAKESALLSAAVDAAANYFETLNGKTLDSNDDGFIDGVTFVVSGAAATDHGNLLWPHSWNLYSITGKPADANAKKIAGVKVGDFAFNFIDEMNTGVLCHEFSHVLGAPDLYHYNSNDFVPVGSWDLMQTNHRIPQYSLVYTRATYIGGIGAEQILTVNHNGVYSLKAVSAAGKNDVIAVKIPTGKTDEYIMAEYRNPQQAVTYDSTLPGGGLIVYRIKEGITTGNQEAAYQNASKPDEVYVYRPKISKLTNLYESSREDVNGAYLAPDNPHGYTAVGKTSTSTKYDGGALFYTDGTNTGITIEAVSRSSLTIEFRVRVNSADTVSNTYFNDKVSIASASYVNDTYAGVAVDIALADGIEMDYLAALRVSLQDAGGNALAENVSMLNRLREEYAAGARRFTVPFVVSEKGSIVQSLFSMGVFDYAKTPVRAVLETVDADGDRVTVATLTVSANGENWGTIQNTVTAFKAGLSASQRITVGVRADGTVITSGVLSTGQWAAGAQTAAISSAAGFSHTLLLKNTLRVAAFGNGYYGETAVGEWTDVIAVAAGYYVSYGLKTDGTVLAAGLNTDGQTEVEAWGDIVNIAAGARHIAGLKADGTVCLAGAAGGMTASELNGVKTLAAGEAFTAGLTAEGTVVVTGTLAGHETVRGWTEVVKIAAGGSVLYALKADGTVLAAGDNSAGQCETDDLLDIIDLAAGELHGAFLRMDGRVFFAGAGYTQYGTNDLTANLIYDSYVDVTSVRLSEIGEMETGTAVQAAGSVLPLNASYARLVYSSSDESVFTVDKNGTVTAKKTGTATLTARLSGGSLSASVTVKVKETVLPTGIAFADDTRSVRKGDDAFLSLSFLPANAYADRSAVTFTSSDPAVLEIISSVTGRVFAHETGRVTVTAVYTKDGYNFSASCEVQVVTDILSILLLQAPDKIEYRYGETLDVTGGIIQLQFEDGSSAEEGLTPDMITGFSATDASRLGRFQTLTVTYGGQQTAFDVRVSDYAVSVAEHTVPKTAYLYGETLSVAGGLMTVRLASGTTYDRALSLSDVYGYAPQKVGEQALTVRVRLYGDTFEYAYLIQVTDTVSSLTQNLMRVEYAFYEAFRTAEETVILRMSSGAVRYADLGDEAVSVTGYQKDILGRQTLQIAYTDPATGTVHTASAAVTVTHPAEGFTLRLTGQDASGVFWFVRGGTGLPMQAYLEFAGESVALSADDSQNIWYTLTDFNAQSGDTQMPRVTVYVRSTTYAAEQETVASRQITAKGITEFTAVLEDARNGVYYYGQTPNIPLKVTVTATSEIVYVTPAADAVSYDPSFLDARQTYTVTYLGKTYTAQIIIYDYLTAVHSPGDTAVAYGEDLDIVLVGETAAGKTVTVTDTCILTGYTAQTVGAQTVTATYAGLIPTYLGETVFVQFTVTVVDLPVSIVCTQAMKTAYLYGEAFNPSSYYAVTMRSGAQNAILYTDAAFSVSPAYRPTLLGEQQIVVTYLPLSETFSYTLTVTDYVAKLEILSPSQTVYNYGDTLALVVDAVYASGKRQALGASAYTVTPANIMQLIGTREVTLRYTDPVTQEMRTAAVTVTVENNPVALTLTKPTKLTYAYGEAFFFEGGNVTVLYKNGEVISYGVNDVASVFAVSFSPLRSGTQTVTLTLKDKSVSYSVTVGAAPAETALLQVTGDIAVDRESACLVLSAPMRYSALASAVSTVQHLRIRFYTADGVHVDSDTSTYIPSGTRLVVENTGGLAVRTYTVYLKGDANFDGVFDASDLNALAESYASGALPVPVGDYDGDGTFSLADLVNWARKASGNNPAEANRTAKAFITDIKGRKKEEAL